MSDALTTSREQQKRRLKRLLIDTDRLAADGRGAEHRQDGQRTDGQDGQNDRPVRRMPHSVRIAVLVVLLLLAFGAFFYVTHVKSTSYLTVWEKELNANAQQTESTLDFLTLGKGVIRYSKDGAAYYDQKGAAIWERSYQMNDPMASASSEYAVIADQGGNSIYIFSKSANTGVATAVLPVMKAVVADTGVVYAVLRDKSAEYITAFRSDGSPIDLSVKSVITGDGMPIDLAVSPDGTQLVTAYLSIADGQPESKVVFRNFGDVGQNADARRIVGGFSDEFAGHLAARVNFSDNSTAQAFYDGGIAFFSTKVLTSPALLVNVPFEQRMRSIACGTRYVAVILEQEEGDAPFLLQIYDTKGKKQGEVPIAYSYTGFEMQGDRCLVYSETAIHIYRPDGTERAALDAAEMQPLKVNATSLPWEYLVSGGGKLYRIRLN